MKLHSWDHSLLFVDDIPLRRTTARRPTPRHLRHHITTSPRHLRVDVSESRCINYGERCLSSELQATTTATITTTTSTTNTAGESDSYRSLEYTRKTGESSTAIDSLRYILLAFIIIFLYFLGLPSCLYGAFGHS